MLARQLLAERRIMSVPQAIEHLVAMQAQAPNSPYVGLWSRLEGFRPEDLAELILARGAVRIALMRSTVHLVTARDCLALRPVVQPVLDRDLFRGVWGGGIVGLDVDELITDGRALLEDRPVLLIDGMVAATWKIAVRRGAATLRVNPLEPLPKESIPAVEDEGARLVAFVAPSATSHEVQFIPPE